MGKLAAIAALLVGACVLVGCHGGAGVNAGSPPTALSPVTGKWTGKSDVKGGDLAKFANSVAGGPLTGPSSLSLNADGTGFLKAGDQPERPISWKQEGDRVILQERGVSGTASEQARGGPWVGDISADGHTMVIDMEKVKVTLSHQPAG